MPGQELLRIENVDKAYGSGETRLSVLHDVNLTIQDGELLVVFGPSGSGKSTLLNLIGGIDFPTGGSIHFQDQNLSEFNDRRLTRYRREHVGFVFQFYNLIPTLTAEENVRVTTELSENAMDPVEALAMVELSDRRDHFPSQLSGGEQQRVAIARAVAKRPSLLLCDEPTGALDLTTGRKVLQVLSDLNRRHGMTVIIITHNSAIGHMANRVIKIGGGTITHDERNTAPVPATEIDW